MEACGNGIGDDGAKGEAVVVIGIKIAAEQPADDFLVGELGFGYFLFVGEDLAHGFLAGVGDVFRALRGVAAVVAFEVNGIDHDKTAGGMFEGGEGESTAE